MTEYHFCLIVRGQFGAQVSDEDLLNATEVLGEAGCNDCSIGVHGQTLELEFDRVAQSLQEAIASAIRDVEGAGYGVESVRMERDAVLAGPSA